MTSAEQFGVVFAPESFATTLMDAPEHQLALYARDRSQAAALVVGGDALGREHGLVVQARKDQPSFVALDQDVQTFGQFANLLPLLFLVAAVLGAFILLSRLVSAQRAVIGTLAANGIAPRTLRRHYLGYGLVAGIAAAIPGLVLGVLLGRWLTTMYTDALGLPLHVTSLHATTLAIAAAAGSRRHGARRVGSGPRRGADDAGRGDAGRARRSRVTVAARTGRAARPAPAGAVADGRARPRPQPPPGRVHDRRRRGVAQSRARVRRLARHGRERPRPPVRHGRPRRRPALRDAGQDARAVVAAARRDPAVAAAEPFARVEVTLTHGAKALRHDPRRAAAGHDDAPLRRTRRPARSTLPASGRAARAWARQPPVDPRR